MNTKKIILGIGAHPDDMDFTASGTISKMIEEEGAEAYYLVCTDGSRGSRHHRTSHEALAITRRQEQRAAGKIIGLKDIFFLDHRDTQLVANTYLKEQIVRIIRTVRPNIVITMDPTFYYAAISPWGKASMINHTDHREAGVATMDAVFPLSRDTLIFPEHVQQGLKPHKVDELWFTSFDKREHVVDISGTFDKKINALMSHKSQFDDFDELIEEVKSHARYFAMNESFEYGESFIRLILN